MAEANTAGGITVTVPTASDAADINKAFKDYHANVGNAISIKANTASPTFTGNVTAPNLLATTGVIAPTITSNTAHANVHTITLVGQASSAVKAARYYPAAAAGYDSNSATVNQTRVIVSQNSPNTATLQTGDVWISWTA
mgnify:CR=1 FL=1|jgi:hypothetical protein